MALYVSTWQNLIKTSHMHYTSLLPKICVSIVLYFFFFKLAANVNQNCHTWQAVQLPAYTHCKKIFRVLQVHSFLTWGLQQGREDHPLLPQAGNEGNRPPLMACTFVRRKKQTLVLKLWYNSITLILWLRNTRNSMTCDFLS